MLKRVLCFFSFMAVCVTTQFSQSQVAGQSTKNNLTPSKTLDVHAQSPTKENLDVRDYGVDCTFTNDSSAALNALTNNVNLYNGYAIRFPRGCHVKLANTWTIKNLSAFVILGYAGAGNNGGWREGVATFTWTGASGGTMIDMEYVDGFEVDHIGIDGGGLAAVGINVDKTGAGGTVNTTDGIFRRLLVGANESGGAGNANWIGMRFSAVSGSNVEDMRITDSVFYCGPSNTSGTAAIKIANSFNAKNYLIEHNFIHQCNRGVWETQGGADILYNEVGTNHIDFEVDYYTDPIRISYNLSESGDSGDQFLVLGNVAHVVEVTGNNIPVNNSCAITFPDGGTISSPNGNTFYNGFGGGVGGSKICNGAGSQNPPSITGSLSNFDITVNDIATFVAPFTNGPHPIIDSASMSNAPKEVPLSTGGTFLERAVFYNNNDSDGTRFGPTNQAETSTACALNTICRDEGSEETGGVISPDGVLCTVSGTDTSTTHSYYVSASDASGNETFLAPGNAATCHGPATFDGSHYETVSWLASPTAASYNVYAANPRNPGNNVQQIATGVTGTSFKFNGPFPLSFSILGEKNLYNKTLSRIFRGKEIDFQFGTPLRGYSDKGVKETLTLDPSTGNSTFNGVMTFLANASTTGTTANSLVKLAGAPSTGVISATTDTSGIIGICQSGCGTRGTARIVYTGKATCNFDGATTAGHYVQISSSVGGDCTDAGSSRPSSGEIIGRVLATLASAGSASVLVQLENQ
jgi:hypothetical protein